MALGCALAAAAAGTGPYLRNDQKVPPFRLIARRPRRVALPKHKGGLAATLDRVASWVGLVLQVVVLLVAAVVVGFAVYRLVKALLKLSRLRLARSTGRRRGAAYDDDPVTDDAEEVLRRKVADELTALSADLDTAPDPREAVIACYVRMERALADAGSPRHPDETPFELLDRVLTEQRVPEPDVRRLTDLFTEARYSDHPVSDEMRAAARRSVDAVAAALAVTA